MQMVRRLQTWHWARPECIKLVMWLSATLEPSTLQRSHCKSRSWATDSQEVNEVVECGTEIDSLAKEIWYHTLLMIIHAEMSTSL